MQRFGLTGAVLVLAVVVVSCNTLLRQPGIRRTLIEPAELKPGDTALITVDVADRYGIVDRVQGVVREDRRVKFQLRDDGLLGDEKPGDGLWTLRVDVPFQAPPGDFTLEFTAYGKDGEPLVVRDKDRGAIPLASSVELTIHHPEEAQE